MNVLNSSRKVLLAVLALCFALAACGSDTATSDATSEATSEQDDAMEMEDEEAMEDGDAMDHSDDDAMEMEDGDKHDGDDHDDEDHKDHDDEDHDDAMDHDGDAMEGMSMGDANATPAAEVDGAEITVAPFTLLDSSPGGYDAFEGTATIARYEGTTITIEFTGLEANKDYISHLHAGSCDEGGGPHFKFDPDGSDMPPNEIHLAFTSSASGEGFMTAENEMAATGDDQSVVVHLAGQMSDKIGCAQL